MLTDDVCKGINMIQRGFVFCSMGRVCYRVVAAVFSLQACQTEVNALKRSLSRHPLEFTVGQYNILAGYMGN